jgi:hypothetical protein
MKYPYYSKLETCTSPYPKYDIHNPAPTLT